MAMLTHPLLLRMSQHIDKKRCPIRWIDLYAAQYMADIIVSKPDPTPESSSKSTPSQARQGQTLDLFAEEEACKQTQSLSEEDLLVLGIMCSYVSSVGQTCLAVTALPPEILHTAMACGYQPGFQTTEQLSQALKLLDQPAFIYQADSFYLPDKLPGQTESSDAQTAIYHAPLILCQDRLYLAKYWRLHQRFEAWLHSREGRLDTLPDDIVPALSKMLSVLFELDQKLNTEQPEVDWQALAAAHTLMNPFSLITGGPGTGKTTTAASLLCLLIYKYQLNKPKDGRPAGAHPRGTKIINIHLLAPTGKAAVRLADAIRFQLLHIETRLAENGINIGRLSDYLPAAGETVHRFLYERGGLRDTFARPKAFNSDQVLFKHGQQQLRTAEDEQRYMEVIIVDESSMMDLALMVELISLIPGHAQLILLGDHYQLPAVDPGQVFADCVARFSCQQATPEESEALAKLTGFPVEALAESVQSKQPELGFQPLCTLRKTYRFGGDLKRAADFIKEGDLRSFKEHFREQGPDPGSAQVIWHPLNQIQQTDLTAMVNGYQDYFDAVADKADLQTLASRFETYQLLCSTLEGPVGVESLNRFIEQHFHQSWQANAQSYSPRDGAALYHGKAILVSRNQPHLGIFNGDIGFVIEDERDGNLNVHFPVANQSELIVAPARIKDWQTAYAMTVHKSQGSEYRRVGVVMAAYAKELLTRSLLYTALTRSKEHCAIWATEDALKKAFE